MPIKQPATMPTELPDDRKQLEKDHPSPTDKGLTQNEADIVLREKRERVERAASERDDPASDFSSPDLGFFDPDFRSS